MRGFHQPNPLIDYFNPPTDTMKVSYLCNFRTKTVESAPKSRNFNDFHLFDP